MSFSHATHPFLSPRDSNMTQQADTVKHKDKSRVFITGNELFFAVNCLSLGRLWGIIRISRVRILVD